MKPLRHRPFVEIGAVLATGGTFLIWENVLEWPKLPFIAACTVAWTVYLVARIRDDRRVLRDWGLRLDTLPAASLACGAVLVLGIGILASIRLVLGWNGFPPSLLVILALYPIWGFLQQFVVQALVANNLRTLGAPAWSIVPLSAVVFGAAHVPDWTLSGLCVGAGLAWTTIFLWRPNLVPLALTHAWLGTLTYWWALGRNPWLEMFPPGP